MDLLVGLVMFASICFAVLWLKVLFHALLIQGRARELAKKKSGRFVVHGMQSEGNGRLSSDKRLSAEAIRSI